MRTYETYKEKEIQIDKYINREMERRERDIKFKGKD